MRGHLAGSTAVDACRDLAEQGATGLLSVDGPDGVGTIAFVDGRIVAATSPTPRSRIGDRLVGSGYLDEATLRDVLEYQRTSGDGARIGAVLAEQGLVPGDAIRLVVQEQVLDALFDVLRWRFGTFEFVDGEAVQVEEVPLHVPVDEALVEVSRRQHEWEELSQVIPNLEAIPAFRPGASSAAAALEPDEFAVLASVDGERSVRALAADLGYGEFEAARIVYGLSLLGIVEVRAPEDAVGAALDDALSYVQTHPSSPGDAAASEPPEAEDVADGVEVVTASHEADVAELDDLLARLDGDEADAAVRPDPTSSPPRQDDAAEPDLFVAHIEESPPRGPRHPPAPSSDAPSPDAPSPDAPSSAAAGSVPPERQPPARQHPTTPGSQPPRPPAEDADVSEFLRELSRLALGSEATEPQHPDSSSRPPVPRAPEPPRRGDPDDRGRRKRGLFGRGG